MKYSYKGIGNTTHVILLLILFFFIILFNSYTKSIELFTMIHNNDNDNDNDNNIWSNDLIKRFLIYQSTVNLNKNQYNLDILQQQATPEEVETLLDTGFWPWPDNLKQEYMDKVWSSPIVKIDPAFSLDYMRKIYNKRAIEELLSWDTKEGHVLLYGSDLGVSKDMPKNVHNTIKCEREINTDGSEEFVMKKKIYTGMNLWNGYMNYNKEIVPNDDIPNEMPGFRFVKDSCNPCAVLNTPSDFSCPFQLNVKGNNEISSVWKTLWNL